MREDLVDEAKQLLHDCVLTQVIVARLYQLPVADARAAPARRFKRGTAILFCGFNDQTSTAKAIASLLGWNASVSQ